MRSGKAKKYGKKLMIFAASILTIVLLIFLVVFVFVFNKNDRKLWTLPKQTILQGDTERHYRVYVPENYDQSKKYSMLLLIHGFSSNERFIGIYTGIATLAEQEDIIVVLPQGQKANHPFAPRSWNAEICCGYPWQQGSPDSQLLLDISKRVADQYSINSEKKYVAGFSNGAMMTQKLLIDYPNEFSAMAVMSGAIGAQGKTIGTPEESVNAMFINGSKDTSVPVNGGSSSSNFSWSTREEMLSAWTRQCNTSEDSSSSSFTERIYKCDTGVTVRAELHDDLPHRWLGARHKNPKDDVAEGTLKMWEFFESL